MSSWRYYFQTTTLWCWDHLSELLDGTSWDQFTNCDEDVCTFATATSDSQQTATPIADDEDDDEETDAADPAPPAPPVSLKLALQSLQTLQTFALENEDDKILKLVDQTKQLVEQMKLLQITTSKQTKLDNYFKWTLVIKCIIILLVLIGSGHTKWGQKRRKG